MGSREGTGGRGFGGLEEDGGAVKNLGRGLEGTREATTMLWGEFEESRGALENLGRG